MRKKKTPKCSREEFERVFSLIYSLELGAAKKKRTLAEELEFSADQLKTLRKAAGALLKAQRFDEAAKAYTFLAAICPFEVHAWIGLGQAEQGRSNSKAALEALGTASLLNLEEPSPHLVAAECFIRDQDYPKAALSLSIALDCVVGKKEYAALKKRIEILSATVNRKLGSN